MLATMIATTVVIRVKLHKSCHSSLWLKAHPLQNQGGRSQRDGNTPDLDGHKSKSSSTKKVTRNNVESNADDLEGNAEEHERKRLGQSAEKFFENVAEKGIYEKGPPGTG